MCFIVAVDDSDAVLANALKGKTHHFNVEVLSFCDVYGTVHTGCVKAANIGKGKKLDLVFVQKAFQIHLIAQLGAQHIADLAVQQLFVAGTWIKAQLRSAGCGTGVGKHNDFIDLVGFQHFEHISHGEVAFACTGGTMQHRDFIARQAVKGEFLIRVSILSLYHTEHIRLERFIFHLDVGIAVPTEQVNDRAVRSTQDKILVREQIVYIFLWVLVQNGVVSLGGGNLFISGIGIVRKDIGGRAYRQLKNIGGKEFAADIVGTENNTGFGFR